MELQDPLYAVVCERCHARRRCVRQNGGMTTDDLAPRNASGGIVAIWALGALLAALTGVFAPVAARATWLIVGLAVCLIVAFIVQLVGGRSHEFTQRVAISVFGALLTMGIVSLGFGLASLVPA